jgi:hypothetical protein
MCESPVPPQHTEPHADRGEDVSDRIGLHSVFSVSRLIAPQHHRHEAFAAHVLYEACVRYSAQ